MLQEIRHSARDSGSARQSNGGQFQLQFIRKRSIKSAALKDDFGILHSSIYHKLKYNIKRSRYAG